MSGVVDRYITPSLLQYNMAVAAILYYRILLVLWLVYYGRNSYTVVVMFFVVLVVRNYILGICCVLVPQRIS